MASNQLTLNLDQVPPRIRTVKAAMDSPAARRRDPVSSKLAASELAESGDMESQLLVTLALVRKYPGKTSHELSRYGSLDRWQIARRLPQLRSAGLVLISSDLRPCGVSGKRCHTWQATNGGNQ
jgi:hypothetical protein